MNERAREKRPGVSHGIQNSRLDQSRDQSRDYLQPTWIAYLRFILERDKNIQATRDSIMSDHKAYTTDNNTILGACTLLQVQGSGFNSSPESDPIQIQTRLQLQLQPQDRPG